MNPLKQNTEHDWRWVAHATWIAALCLLGATPASAQATAPQSLTATPLHGQRIDLSWTDASNDETGYRIVRSCTSDGRPDHCTLASLPENSQTYRDVGVQAGTTYEYRVETISPSGTEVAVASATTPPRTALPRSEPPAYPEPQGVWSLGPVLSLTGIEQAEIRHNLASSRDLRILLDPSNSRSLLGRLKNAGYSTHTRRRHSGNPEAGQIEIYFYDITRGSPEGPLPREIETFDRMGEEGYVLVVQATGKDALRMVVGANGPKGLFRGAMTVQRLLINDSLDDRRKTIEPVIILDYPDHSVRGGAPNWKPMNANLSSLPDKTFDKLDEIARAGGTAVSWAPHWAIQEAFTWDRNGVRAAAAMQIAAADRFMDVSYTLGSSQVGFGTKRAPGERHSETSFDQFPYYDGLGVVNEPFLWIEVNPGSWQAVSRRQGTLLTRDTSMTEKRATPWLSERCRPNGWAHDTTEGRADWKHASWRIDGPSTDCSLSQSLSLNDAFSTGRYALSAWFKASSDASGISGEVTLELERQNKPKIRYSVKIPNELSSSSWTEVSLMIPDLDPGKKVTSARLVVRASLDAGKLWLDNAALYEWDRNYFPFGSGSHFKGWSGNSKGIEFDHAMGHREPGSIRIETPFKGKKTAQSLSRFENLQLEPGRYLLTHWIKAAWAKPDANTEADDDNDGLPNRVETKTGKFRSQKDTGSHPQKFDSDSDGFGDGTEVQSKTDPNDQASKPDRNFPVRGDINLFFYDQLTTGKRNKSHPIMKEYMRLPTGVRVEKNDWLFQIQVIDISEEMAARIKSVRVQLRIFDQNKKGTVWIDDIEFRRFDGELRNLLGALKPPNLTDASGTRLIEGSDYEICQIGSGRLESCQPPENYTTILEGGLTGSFHDDRPPFEIRWLSDVEPTQKAVSVSYDIGAQYSTVSTPRLRWDGTIYTSGELNFCDPDALFEGLDLETIFGRALDGYIIQDFPSRGQTYNFRADDVTWGVSEVRGINRSIACLDPDGQPTRSNAALFADIVNHAVSLARSKRPDVRFWLWNDMFNPFNNGGDPEYQVKYGGARGSSACSYAPAELPSLCRDEIANVPYPIIENQKQGSSDLVMKPWSYSPKAIRQMTAISSWYQRLGVTSQVMPGADPVNVEDWASLAHTYDKIAGVDATVYYANLYAGRSGLLKGYRSFWNHDWKLLYLHDNETEASSHYQIEWPFEPGLELENADLDLTGRCAHMTAKFAGNNDAGICLASPPAVPTITLSQIPVLGGASYRIDLLAERANQSANHSSRTHPPQVHVLWSNGEKSGPISSKLIYNTTKKRVIDWFDRYRAEVDAPENATGMEIQIEFGPGGAFTAADDIAIFESIPPCFDSCDLKKAGNTRTEKSTQQSQNSDS